MTRLRRLTAVAGPVLLLLAACRGTEPSDDVADLPELVFLEREQATGLWSIRGYHERIGTWEVAPGTAAAPRPAGDGLLVHPTSGELLYRSAEPDGLVLLDPATGDVRRPSTPGVPLSWSPRGDLLATWSGPDLLIITLDGDVRRTVCEPPADCGTPAWTADGDAVAVSRTIGDGKPDIWRVPVGAGAEVNLTATLTESETHPAWSPDGTRIAYYQDEDAQLIVTELDGGDRTRVFGPIAAGDLAWLPDGQSLAARGELEGETGIIRVPLSGVPALLVAVSERAVDANQIRWSPDSERLAYVAHDGLTSAGHSVVFVIRSDGSDRRLVSGFGHTALGPVWLPTGER